MSLRTRTRVQGPGELCWDRTSSGTSTVPEEGHRGERRQGPGQQARSTGLLRTRERAFSEEAPGFRSEDQTDGRVRRRLRMRKGARQGEEVQVKDTRAGHAVTGCRRAERFR